MNDKGSVRLNCVDDTHKCLRVITSHTYDDENVDMLVLTASMSK